MHPMMAWACRCGSRLGQPRWQQRQVHTGRAEQRRQQPPSRPGMPLLHPRCGHAGFMQSRVWFSKGWRRQRGPVCGRLQLAGTAACRYSSLRVELAGRVVGVDREAWLGGHVVARCSAAVAAHGAPSALQPGCCTVLQGLLALLRAMGVFWGGGRWICCQGGREGTRKTWQQLCSTLPAQEKKHGHSELRSRTPERDGTSPWAFASLASLTGMAGKHT